ncbi:uncharacterized protein LOC141666779 [Apium graveolens]|uniref:uncharacterized protein LOC141666779 n=1 Tax=Apium graveolens TaxID=4045 RepID=UPI003D7B66EA
MELASDIPEMLNALLARFYPETRQMEFFDNYATTAERRQYQWEPLEDFLVRLHEDIIDANSKFAGLVDITRSLKKKSDADEKAKTDLENANRELKKLKSDFVKKHTAHKRIVDGV